MPFSDRAEAGRLLSRKLLEQIPGLNESRPVVVAIPPGGVPVGVEVARALDASLDIAIIRKLNGFGAVSEDEFYWVDPGFRRSPGISVERLESALVREAEEVRREVEAYRGGHPPIDVEDSVVVLVQDAIVTGIAARAAAHVLHGRGAHRIVLAAPVCPPAAIQALMSEDVIETVVAVDSPDHLDSAEEWYEELRRFTDDDIRRALSEARRVHHLSLMKATRRAGTAGSRSFRIRSERGPLEGILDLPAQAKGIILFAHGSGSSRLSPRNRAVAEWLNRAGFATLLFDLLTMEEADNRDLVFDIGLLSRRLRLAIQSVRSDPELSRLPMGLFGASTGAAAALRAAAGDAQIGAVVSRGGRPDLTGPDASKVGAPVLLIVGGNDVPVLEMNRQMLDELPNSELEIVPGATHLFEEPGTLERVSQLAAEFFNRHLAPAARARAA